MEYLTEQQVIGLSGLPRTTLHRRIAAGSFPKARKIDGWHIAWLVGEVRAWLCVRALRADAQALSSGDISTVQAVASALPEPLLAQAFPRFSEVSK